MKYETLAIRQIDKTQYQYSLNGPCENLSPILSFDDKILNTPFENEMDYVLECAKRKEILNNGYILTPKDTMTIQEWAPFLVMATILQYYKAFQKLPPMLMSIDQELQNKYSQEEWIRKLFQ